MSETIEYDLTGNYGLKKPWLDADDDVWGEHINENMDKIDNLLVTRGFDASKYLPLIGGEITGDLSVLGELSTPGPVVTTGIGPALVGSSTGAGIVLNDSTSNRLAGALTVDGLHVGALLTATTTGVEIAAPQFIVDAPSLIELNGPIGSVFLGPDTNTLGGAWYLSIDPVDDMGVATKRYVDAHTPAGGPFLPIAGGEITGSLRVDGTTRLYATPTTGPVVILSAGGNVPATFPTNALLNLVGNPGAAFNVDAFAGQAQMGGRRANGTATAPTALAASNNIYVIAACGYGSTGYSGVYNFIRAQAAQAWTDTAQGLLQIFSTVPNGSTTLAEVMRLQASGNVSIGSATDAGFKLDVTGSLRAGSIQTTALLTNAANDAAAATAGVPLNQFYRNGSAVMQRVA